MTGSGGEAKKVFPCRELVDSRIHGTENHTEHLVHGTIPSGSRSEFLAAYHTPSRLAALRQPLCPRHILSLSRPAPSATKCRKKIQQISSDFPRTTNRNDLLENSEHVDRRASSALSSIGNYPPPSLPLSLSFPYNFPDFASPVRTNVSRRLFKFPQFSARLPHCRNPIDVQSSNCKLENVI